MEGSSRGRGGGAKDKRGTSSSLGVVKYFSLWFLDYVGGNKNVCEGFRNKCVFSSFCY